MKTSILRALSEVSFRYLWVGEVFTQIATHLFNFFLIIVVFEITHSNTAVSGIVLSFTVPAIIFGSLAGIFVDRWDKKTVIIVTNLIRAVLLIILIFSLHNLFLIYLISFLVAVLVQFFIPAEAPMVPLTVKPQHLLSANALFGIAIYGSIMVAYILSGPLIIFFGETNTLVALAVMLAIGAGFISLIKKSHIKEKVAKTIENNVNILKDIRHTLSLISRTKEISNSLFLLALSQILILIIATIAPGYAHQVLNIDIKEFPLLFVAPAAFGMVIGGVVITNFFHSHPKTRVINIGIFLSGISMLLFPYGSKVASRGFI
jgi:MFS family permease